MRTLGSAILVLVSLLLAAVAGPAIWAERNIVSEAGFVELAGPLGANTDFQQGLSTMVAQQASAQLNVPPALQGLASGIIKSAAQSVYTQPGYAAAWTETLRRSHALTFAPAADQQGQGDLHLDIAPMVALVATKVSADMGVTLPTPKQVPVSLDQPAVAKAIPLVTKLGGLGGWLAFIAVDLLLLAVVVARKRSATLIWAGLGMAVVALVWLLGSGFAVDQVNALGAGNETVAQFGREIGARAQASWTWGINFGFIVAGALVVAGLIGRMMRRTRTT